MVDSISSIYSSDYNYSTTAVGGGSSTTSSGITGTDYARATGSNGDNFTRSSSATSAEVQRIERELEEKKQKKADNEAEIEKLTQEIEKLKQDAQAKRDEAKRKEDEYNSQVESTQLSNTKLATIKDQLMDKYLGQGLSADEVQEKVNADIDRIQSSRASRVDSSLLDEADSLRSAASDLESQIPDKQDRISVLENENITLTDEIAQLEKDLEAAKQAAAQQQQSGSNGSGGSNSAGASDPIGFEFDGETYDFIKVDEDGMFNSSNDFLGADNQWAAMEELDADGNGQVSADEMKKAGVQLVKHNKDGSNEIVEVDDKRFGSGMSIDLSTYNEGSKGADSSLLNKIDTGDHDGDGTSNQSLLGNFKININGQEKSGYNTLDDNDFLDNKFFNSNPFGSNSSVTSGAKFNKATNPFDRTSNASSNSDLRAKGESVEAQFELLRQQILDEARDKAEEENDENNNTKNDGTTQNTISNKNFLSRMKDLFFNMRFST